MFLGGWAIGAEIKIRCETPTFHLVARGFECQLCSEFELLANGNPGKQQVPVAGFLATVWGTQIDSQFSGFSLAQARFSLTHSRLLEAIGEKVGIGRVPVCLYTF